jgi:hypothetical protein
MNKVILIPGFYSVGCEMLGEHLVDHDYLSRLNAVDEKMQF